MMQLSNSGLGFDLYLYFVYVGRKCSDASTD